VMITPELAAELALLSQAIDLPDADVGNSLTRLAADARTAVDSYLGLSVAITANRSQFDLTMLDETTDPRHIRASLLVPLSGAIAHGRTAPVSIALILYAATAGAYVDLAADLSWITGRDLAEFRLDEHRALPSSHADATPMSDASTINQALGVLIGQGAVPEQAERDLYSRAASAGVAPVHAATLILAGLTPPPPAPTTT
jgi:hypothetical protein